MKEKNEFYNEEQMSSITSSEGTRGRRIIEKDTTCKLNIRSLKRVIPIEITLKIGSILAIEARMTYNTC